MPEITLPRFSSPELQVPGITVPSFSFPNFAQASGFHLDSIKLNFFTNFNVNSNWFGVLGSSFSDLVGLPQKDGSSNTIFGNTLNIQPTVSGNVNLDGVDLTGKARVSDVASVNAIVANAEYRNTAEAQEKTEDPAASATGTTYANEAVWDQSIDNNQNAAQASPSTSITKVSSSSGTTYQLPSLTFDDIALPSFSLNGFDLSGYSRAWADH
jgi:hypothetical protein